MEEDIKDVETETEESCFQCSFCELEGPLSIITEHIETHTATTTSQISVIHGVWGIEETTFLLDKFKEYICHVGPKKKFRSKKELWQKISQDLEESFSLYRSPTQIENRYKTIMKRKRKALEINPDPENEVEIIKIRTVLDDTEVIQENPKHVIIKEYNAMEKRKRVDEIVDVLVQLHDKKEEARERRHKEKLALLKNMCEKFFYPGQDQDQYNTLSNKE